MNPLSTTSILLHLTISKWAGEVTDKSALVVVSKAFSSDTHNDKYKKSLFISDPLSLIDRCAGRIRNHFYHDTMSWLDQGRLIPSRNFRDFAIAHKKLKNQFYEEVEKFIEAYPEHCELAKQNKGDMYLPHEYPSVEQVRQKFGITLTTLPFPTTKDFRVDAPEQIIEELKLEMENSLISVGTAVDTEIQGRLVTRLNMLLSTLTTGKRFNSSLLEELQFIIDMGNNLATTTSQKTKDVITVIEAHILAFTPEQVRNSQILQDNIVECCRALI